MANPKTKGKTSTKTKSRKSGRTIQSFMYLPMAIALIIIMGAGYVLIASFLTPVNASHRVEIINTVAEQYEAYVNNVLTQHDALLSQLVSSDELVSAITTNNVERIELLEQRIVDQIPNALTAHVFPMRAGTQQEDVAPPLSHAGLDMIRRAEQGQTLPIEAHQFDGQAYLQSVRGVRNGEGRLIGSISIAQSLDYLSNQLAAIDPTKGNLLIQQQFESAPVQTLVTYGAKNNNEVITLRSNNPNWTLTFQPSDDLTSADIMEPNLVWTIFGAMALLVLLPILVSTIRLQRSLRQDANQFAKQIQAVFGGQSSAGLDYEFQIFSILALSVNRMRMGKGSFAAAPKGAAGYVDSLPGKAIQAEEEFFDVSMMEQDSDLLGMNQSSNASHVDISESIFRAYDIRGIVGQTLNNETAMQIGLAIGSEANDRGEKTIIVGRDGRLSSPELSQHLIRGLIASGRDVVDIGMVPTPVAYFACKHLNIDSCVVVTGSHNPTNYNGFKVVLGNTTLAEDEIRGLYHRIENRNFASGDGKVSTQDVNSAYLLRVSEDVKSQRPLKVVVDAGNGVTGAIAPQLIKGIGCHVLPLYCDVDGNFPNHHPDPSVPSNLTGLTRTVVETRADLGIAFDGDGDRVGLVTNSGKVIMADRLLMLLAKYVLQSNPGATVLYDVKCSRRLSNLISGHGGKPMMWKSGHSLMKRKMRETKAALGGELSGHIFYQERWYGFDDGMYVAARLIEILSQQPETLDTLFAELPDDVATPEITITTTDERKFRIVQALQRNAQFPNAQINDIDGVRADFSDGWGLVRASNTSPALTCRFEANDETTLRRIQGVFRQQLLAVDSNLQIPF